MLSVKDILQPENVSYTDNVWTWAVAHMLHKGEDWQITTITDTAPIEIVFLSKGEPLTDFIISGNTVQDGTPTPDDPVDVVGCGEKTENLFDESAFYSSITGITQQGTFSISGGTLTVSSGNENVAYTMPFQPGDGAYRLYVQQDTTYYVNFENSENSRLLMFKNGLAHAVISMAHPTTFRTDSDAEFYTLRFGTVSTVTSPVTIWIKNIMINTGSTPLPYEPYGYKLPISCGGTEYPIYLGQVPTTRRVKKLVLDGTEMLHMYDRNGYVAINDGLQQTLAPYCDILPGTTLPSTESPDSVKQLMTNIGGISCAILFKVSTGFSSIDAFRAWIEENTPTVWYVLAEPETGIVNEPLMKIGEYADTISFAQASVTIPTIAGTNTLAVDTTVQPSEVSITGNIKEVQGT